MGSLSAPFKGSWMRPRTFNTREALGRQIAAGFTMARPWRDKQNCWFN